MRRLSKLSAIWPPWRPKRRKGPNCRARVQPRAVPELSGEFEDEPADRGGLEPEREGAEQLPGGVDAESGVGEGTERAMQLTDDDRGHCIQ